MKAYAPLQRGSMAALASTLLLIATASPAHATPVNRIGQVVARADGAKTIVTIRTSGTPSFTAYRLDRPARLVVDIANGTLDNGDLIDVDSWAVGQIASTEYNGNHARLARVMVGLKRAATYDVKADGNNLIVTITADEAPTADALSRGPSAAERQAIDMQVAEAKAAKQRAEASAQEAEAGRKRAEAARINEEKKLDALKAARLAEESKAEERQRALVAESAANARAELARKEAMQAKERAQTIEQEAQLARERLASAKREIEQLATTRAREQARLADVQQTLAADKSRVEALRREADALVKQRDAEIAKMNEAQAQARRAIEEKTARLEDAKQMLAMQGKTLDSLRAAEEKKAKLQLLEAQRLERLAKTESSAADAEMRARQAMTSAKAEQARLDELARSAQKITGDLSLTQQELGKQKAELERLLSEQQRERARLEQSRAEARAVQQQRSNDSLVAQAGLQAALNRIKQVESEAQQRAAQAAKESEAQRARLASAQEAVRVRAAELDTLEKRLSTAQLSAAERDRELRRTIEAREAEEQRVAMARTQKDQLQNELRQLEAQRVTAQRELSSEMKRTQEERAKLGVERAKLDSDIEARRQQQASLEADLARSKAQQASLEAELAKKRAERARLDASVGRDRDQEKQVASQMAMAAARAKEQQTALEQKLAARQREQAQLEQVLAEKRQEWNRLDSQLVQKRNESASIDSSIEKKRGEQQQLDSTIGSLDTMLQKRRSEQASIDTLIEKRRREQAAIDAMLERRRNEQAMIDSMLDKKRGEQSSIDTTIEKKRGEQASIDQLLAKKKSEQSSLDSLIAKKKGEQSSLDSLIDHKRAEQSALEAQIDRKRNEQAALDTSLDRKRAEQQSLDANMAAARMQQQDLDAKVVAAKRELERLEAAAKQKLAIVPTPAKTAATLPKIEIAQVRDVRFVDDGNVARVVVDLDRNVSADVVSSDGRTTVLRLGTATVPKRLVRTLDASAYRGPVRSVSTYVDPEDPSAVRIAVSLDPKQTGLVPQVSRDNGSLTWEFSRGSTHARSLAPATVAAYGVGSIPLQTAASMTPSAAGTSTPMTSSGANNRRRKVYTGRRIDLDFKDYDIHNMLRLLSDVGQVNIVTADDVKGTVTIRMRDVPWDQALDVILRSKGLGMQREGNLIRVAPAATLEKELEAEIARAKAQVELKPVETRLIPLSYANAAQMMARVQDVMSSRGKASIDERTNMLIVSDVASNIALAEELVRNLDTQTPQVNIEARIVEARSNFLRTIGIQWGGSALASPATGNPTGAVFPSTIGIGGGATDATAPTSGLNLPAVGAVSPNYVVNLPAPVGTGSGGALGLSLGSVSGAFNINLRLSALENTGQVRIVSSPKITTLDNVEATIEQGVAIPISVVSAAGTNTIFVDAKLNLTVKPHVTNEGSVIMNVNITRNEPDFVNTGARGDPTILKKQAKTEMLVRDGDTAVIGGIYTRNSGVSYSKVPGLGDIPILGWLFKTRRENDDRTELLIFITPRIVNRAAVVRR